MNNCLLCFQNSANVNNFILTESEEWLQLNIPIIIEKHMWPIDNLKQIFGICKVCWHQLHDFHIFYTNIKEVQKKFIKIDVEHKTTIFNTINNCGLGVVQIHDIVIPKIELITNDDTTYTINNINETENSNVPPLPTIMIKPKRKRGRPRKKRTTNEATTKKPGRKRGRPRKYNIDKNEMHTNSDSKSNDQKGQGTRSPMKIKRRRGRPSKISTVDAINTSSTHTNEIVISPGKTVLNTEPVVTEVEVEVKDLLYKSNVKNESNTKKMLKRKINYFPIRKKRNKQHKAVMRNYIATSVRCMKFLKQ